MDLKKLLGITMVNGSLIRSLFYKIKKVVYLASAKRLDVLKLAKREIQITQSDIHYFVLSSNEIKTINIKGQLYYFRECKHHTPLKEFIHLQLDHFLKFANDTTPMDNFSQPVLIRISFSTEELDAFRLYFYANEKRVPDFYKKISACKEILKRFKWGIWDGANPNLNEKQLNELGFTKPSDVVYPVLIYFICYISGVLENYILNKFVGINNYECYSACRSAGTYELAKIFGKERLFTSAEIIKLKIGDEIEYGVLSERAEGIRAKDATCSPSNSLRKDLSCMQILDVLAYENDHWVNNYNVVEKNGEAVSACAFDNDTLWAFFPNPNINFRSHHSANGIIDDNGALRCGSLDKDFVEKFMSVTYRDLAKGMSPYLNYIQIAALLIRFYLLRKAMHKSMDRLLPSIAISPKEEIDFELNRGGTERHIPFCITATYRV